MYYDKAVEEDKQATSSTNDATAYTVEVWAYEDGEVKVVYQQPIGWTEGGFAVFQRLDLGDGQGSLLEVERFSDQGSSWQLSFYGLQDGTFSSVHAYSIQDMYSEKEKSYADGSETSLSIDEWIKSLDGTPITYRFSDWERGDAEAPYLSADKTFNGYTVNGCIKLTRETLQKLGIEVVEESTETIDTEAIFSATLDQIKAEAQETSSHYGGLKYQYFDFDADGIDELFVTIISGYGNETTNYIYKLNGDVPECIFDFRRRGCAFNRCYPQTKTVVFEMVYKAMFYTWYYQYEDGALVQKAAIFDATNYNGTLSYETSEGTGAEEEEYAEVAASLEKGEAVELSLDSSW